MSLHVLAWGATYLVHGGVVIVVMLCPRVPVRFPSGLQLISTAGSNANHLDNRDVNPTIDPTILT